MLAVCRKFLSTLDARMFECLLTDRVCDIKNLARDRAMKFGLEDRLSDRAPVPRGHLLPTPSDSLLVSTVATDALGEEQAVTSTKEEEDLRTKPRGFFADQFEVLRIS